MAWWIPLITMAASMKQGASKQDAANNSRLRFYGGPDREPRSVIPMASSSLLESVFGITDKQKKASIFDQLNDINDTKDIGGNFYDLP